MSTSEGVVAAEWRCAVLWASEVVDRMALRIVAGKWRFWQNGIVPILSGVEAFEMTFPQRLADGNTKNGKHSPCVIERCEDLLTKVF